MRIGQLNNLIDILKKQTVPNVRTGETIEKFEPYHRRQAAQMVGAAGGHGTRGQQVHEKANAVFTIRYIRDLDSQMRIRCDDKDYEILSIVDRDGKATWLEIQASEVSE